jgi:hypothetical protein
MAAVLIVLSMFQYIVCDRALLSGNEESAEGFKRKQGFKNRKMA